MVKSFEQPWLFSFRAFVTSISCLLIANYFIEAGEEDCRFLTLVISGYIIFLSIHSKSRFCLHFDVRNDNVQNEMEEIDSITVGRGSYLSLIKCIPQHTSSGDEPSVIRDYLGKKHLNSLKLLFTKGFYGLNNLGGL
jgi:hypothetical protein